MSRTVVDSSALLASIQLEAGSDQVERLPARPAGRALVSTVNLSETQSKLIRGGVRTSTLCF